MPTACLASPAAPALRQDAAVIGLVGVAHSVSHFSQLLLAPLFPWLKDDFNASYTQLGLLLTIFFVTSTGVQAASGFVVDRFGPRPVLLLGLSLLGLAALGYANSHSYTMLAASAVVAGIGNGVFHPVDYTLLNRKVHKSRLGHAYSAHGITGTLGWALAPALMVPVAWSPAGAPPCCARQRWRLRCWRCCGGNARVWRWTWRPLSLPVSRWQRWPALWPTSRPARAKARWTSCVSRRFGCVSAFSSFMRWP